MRAIRPLISVLLITLTVLGLINVYADNSDVQRRAEEVACGREPCTTRLTQLQRSVLAQTFTFDTRSLDGRGGSSNVVVRCQRAFIFAGGYSCETR